MLSDPAAKPCPYCNSSEVVAPAKAASVTGYWRCTRCGEMWHPNRINAHQSYSRTIARTRIGER